MFAFPIFVENASTYESVEKLEYKNAFHICFSYLLGRNVRINNLS